MATELEALRTLFFAARKVRNTAIVDDEFPLLMHEFDSAIREAEKVINTALTSEEQNSD